MINEKDLQNILHRIIEVAKPDSIILFGSQARNEAHRNSDIDLLVVKANAHRRHLAQKIYQNLIGIDFSVDVIVATPEDLEKYKDTSVLIYSNAIKEGRVVYAA